MRKWRILSVASVLLLSLTACEDLTTPEGVLEASFAALKKGNLKAFRTTLGGEALAELGTLDKMKELSFELQGRRISVAPAVFVEDHPTECGGQCKGTVYIYRVTVMTDGPQEKRSRPAMSPWGEATVRCLEVHEWAGHEGEHTDYVRCQVSHWIRSQ